MPDDSSHATPDPVQEDSGLAPIAESRRIDSMDILRGVALVGILLMNIEWFGRSIAEIGTFDDSLTGLDHATGWLIRCLVEGKFYKMFALLFGMGFAVMLIRAREKGMAFGAWFTRRMLVLFIFGVLHMVLIWPGDILHDYAFAGLLLLGWIFIFETERLKKFNQPNTFLRIALIWMIFPIIATTISGGVYGVRFDDSRVMKTWQEEQHIAALIEERMVLPREETESDADSADEAQEVSPEEELEQTVSQAVERRHDRQEQIDTEFNAYTNATYWEATKYRAEDSLSRLRFTPVFALLILFPTFLIGYWMVASGVLKNHHENRHIFKPMALLGLGFGLIMSIGGLVVMQQPAAEISALLGTMGGSLFFFGQYVLCAGYVGLIVLLLEKPRWFSFFSRFAPMGRMALTNYIMQTAILALIFHGYAGGLFGQVPRAPQMLIVIAILAFQLYLSTWWLSKYRFGPLEWLWRSLTYNAIQPMRK